MGNPIDDTKQVCSCCHRLFDPVTGQRAQGMEHIVIADPSKDLCRFCVGEREAWPKG